MMKLEKMTSLWHHLLDVQGNGSTVYYRRIIWKPRKATRNRNFSGLLWHHDIKMWLVTSSYFKLAKWHQIWAVVSDLYVCQFLQPRNELLLLIGVYDRCCHHHFFCRHSAHLHQGCRREAGCPREHLWLHPASGQHLRSSLVNWTRWIWMFIIADRNSHNK